LTLINVILLNFFLEQQPGNVESSSPLACSRLCFRIRNRKIRRSVQIWRLGIWSLKLTASSYTLIKFCERRVIKELIKNSQRRQQESSERKC